MKITKKQIKENTKTSELQNNGTFTRRFQHYFELKINPTENKKYHLIKFNLINNVLNIVTYWNRLNDEPFYEEIHTYEGKTGFINEVYDYINLLK